MEDGDSDSKGLGFPYDPISISDNDSNAAEADAIANSTPGEIIYVEDDDDAEANESGMDASPATIEEAPRRPWDENDYLERVLEMFPDISRSFVRDLFQQYPPQHGHSELALAAIIDQITQLSKYPKQRDEKAKPSRKWMPFDEMSPYQRQKMLASPEYQRLT